MTRKKRKPWKVVETRLVYGITPEGERTVIGALRLRMQPFNYRLMRYQIRLRVPGARWHGAYESRGEAEGALTCLVAKRQSKG